MMLQYSTQAIDSAIRFLTVGSIAAALAGLGPPSSAGTSLKVIACRNQAQHLLSATLGSLEDLDQP
jgi:hypothetical protein